MLPRTGGRDFKDTIQIARGLFARTIDAWEADHRTFTAPAQKARRKSQPKPSPTRRAKKKPAKKR